MTKWRIDYSSSSEISTLQNISHTSLSVLLENETQYAPAWVETISKGQP